jgi:hypothetical protein
MKTMRKIELLMTIPARKSVKPQLECQELGGPQSPSQNPAHFHGHPQRGISLAESQPLLRFQPCRHPVESGLTGFHRFFNGGKAQLTAQPLSLQTRILKAQSVQPSVRTPLVGDTAHLFASLQALTRA